MQITKLAGTLQSSTSLPKFEDIFKSLIDPNKIILHDEFLSNAGPLNGRALEKSPIYQNWQVYGSIVWSVDATGFVKTQTSTATNVALQHARSGKIYATVEIGVLSSYVGLIFRAVDVSNLFRVVINPTLGGLVVLKVVAGVTVQLQQVPIQTNIGDIIHLAVEYDEAGFKVIVNNEEKSSIVNSDLSTNIGVGLTAGSVEHKVWEFAAR